MTSYHGALRYFGTCPSVIVAIPKLDPLLIGLLRSFFGLGFRPTLPAAGMTAAPSAPDADFDLFAVFFALYVGDIINDPVLGVLQS